MKILSKQLEQVEKMYREQKDAAYKHVSLEKSYKKLQADLEESNTTLKRQKDEIRLLSQTVQQQKAVEEKMAKFRAQLSAMRTERDKAVKEATQLAVSNAALETQKAETDSVKAALHDCYEEIENLYDEVERLSASASKADEDTAGRMPDEAIGRSCTSRHKFHERPQEHASALDALKCLKDTAKDASWFRDDLDAIHRELLDVKCNLAQAADKAAADDRELHEMRRAKVEPEKAIGAGESGKRPIENGETEQKLAAANKELESLRAMNSTLGTDRAELMIRLDASEQDLCRLRTKSSKVSAADLDVLACQVADMRKSHAARVEEFERKIESLNSMLERLVLTPGAGSVAVTLPEDTPGPDLVVQNSQLVAALEVAHRKQREAEGKMEGLERQRRDLVRENSRLIAAQEIAASEQRERRMRYAVLKMMGRNLDWAFERWCWALEGQDQPCGKVQPEPAILSDRSSGAEFLKVELAQMKPSDGMMPTLNLHQHRASLNAVHRELSIAKQSLADLVGRILLQDAEMQELQTTNSKLVEASKSIKPGYRDDLDAIHRELLDVKCNLAQAADKAAADDRELHEMRRAKVEPEKAIGAGESGKRPIENGETEQKLAAANKELESLRAMNSTLGTDRAELMIRLDASEQDLKRTNSKLDALRKTLPLAAAAPHSLSALHSPLAPYAPSVTIAGESLEEEFKATKHKLAQEMHRTTTLQSEVGIYQEFLLLS